ncbi:MAG TPA: hypothetical protein VFG30_09900 [Polyangiales bacterium]|nr:hypothetical protein [Polyangiales bacterium]
MRDPTPWLDPTDLERQLLDAARHDAAPAAMKMRMAEALSALPPLAAVESGVHPAAPGSVANIPRGGLLFSHPALWGSLSALIVAGAVSWQVLSHSREQRTAAPAPLAAAAPQPQSIHVQQPVIVLAAAEPTPAPAPAVIARTVGPARAGIREELALLDAARTALAEHEATQALRLLDQHAEQFARGRLTPEADALRIDALVQRGAADKAQRLAKRFLERHSTHPLAAHIATIAQRR